MTDRPPLLPASAKALAVAVFVQTTAFGLLTALGAIYFTRVLGLSVTELGLGLSIAAGAGLASGIPIGHLGDRVGARGLLVALLTIEALAVFAYLLIGSFVSFVVVVALYQFADRAGSAVRGGLVARAVGPQAQTKVRAFLRSVGNAGFAIGAVLAGWGLQTNDTALYRGLIVAAACAYLVAAASVMLVPPVAAVARERAASMSAALRDRPYMAFALVNMVLSFHYAILEVGMPLWVMDHTSAPKWLVTALFVINTAMVVGLQVPVSRRAETLATAKWATVVAGALLAGACGLFAASSLTGAVLAVVVLVGAGLLHALGEMLQTAASWTLAYEMAPEHAHGQYQGLFSTSTSSGLMLGSAVVVLLAVNHGIGGWLLLGALFFAVSLLMPWVVDLAGRRGAAAGPALDPQPPALGQN